MSFFLAFEGALLNISFLRLELTQRQRQLPKREVKMMAPGNGFVSDVVAADRPAAPPRPPGAPPPGSAQLETTLKNADYLLSYAVEAGIALETDITEPIIAARRSGRTVWESENPGALITAITKLAAKLYPVTAETLRACRDDADRAIEGYRWIVIKLAAIILPLSMISFIYTAISNTITTDLTAANALTVTLHTQLDTSTPPANGQAAPVGSLAELQQFAAEMRAIYSRTRQLNLLVPFMTWDPIRIMDQKSEGPSGITTQAEPNPYKLMQLPPDLLPFTKDMQVVLNKLTSVYQEDRLYATSVQDATSVIWGAIATCILPVLYALLGACAYVLRAFTEQTERRTFAPSEATPARFIIAAIGGGVVGLFSNFTIGQSASLSPLALAFLIGYATDVFFSFLEGSMQNLRGSKAR